VTVKPPQLGCFAAISRITLICRITPRLRFFMPFRPVEMRRSLSLVAALALTTLAMPADACWDGYIAKVGRVSITNAMGESSAWSLEQATEVATWSRRIERLLPATTRVEVSLGGRIELCAHNGREEVCRDAPPWTSLALSDLFRSVARATKKGQAARREAMLARSDVFTVQVFASKTEDAARAVARKIDEVLPDVGGFYDEGAHPGTNPGAHVVESADERGQRVFRVVVGAYLSRSDADAARDRVEQTTGLKGFARRVALRTGSRST
jgi:hypothetical protein